MTTEREGSRALPDLLTRAPTSAWIRHGLALLGWGEQERIETGTGADRFDRALRLLQETGAPLALASFTFDENSPGSVVVIPRILIRADVTGTEVIIGDPADLPPPASSRAMPPGRLWDTSADAWRAGVRAALEAISTREVEKVVLSRVVEARFEHEVPIPAVLTRLAGAEPDSHSFLIDRFLGSSPELLVSLAEGSLHSLSLAGSVASADPEGPRRFGTDKMAREHTLAADSVEEALLPYCTELERSQSRVATYGQIRHLATAFQGRSHPGTTVTDLAAALHPTAAVAGTPTKSALELIAEVETHDRGRYAGPVGWFDRSGNGEFAIALRCGTIDGRTARLYTGAGLVEGSDPDLELEETRIKLGPMMRALGLS